MRQSRYLACHIPGIPSPLQGQGGVKVVAPASLVMQAPLQGAEGQLVRTWEGGESRLKEGGLE